MRTSISTFILSILLTVPCLSKAKDSKDKSHILSNDFSLLYGFLKAQKKGAEEKSSCYSPKSNNDEEKDLEKEKLLAELQKELASLQKIHEKKKGSTGKKPLKNMVQKRHTSIKTLLSQVISRLNATQQKALCNTVSSNLSLAGQEFLAKQVFCEVKGLVSVVNSDAPKKRLKKKKSHDLPSELAKDNESAEEMSYQKKIHRKNSFESNED